MTLDPPGRHHIIDEITIEDIERSAIEEAIMEDLWEQHLMDESDKDDLDEIPPLELVEVRKDRTPTPKWETLKNISYRKTHGFMQPFVDLAKFNKAEAASAVLSKWNEIKERLS